MTDVEGAVHGVKLVSDFAFFWQQESSPNLYMFDFLLASRSTAFQCCILLCALLYSIPVQ